MKEFVGLEDVQEYNKQNPDKEICEFCFQSLAEWFYGPAGGDGPRIACDKCVPRGCSCNAVLIDENRLDDFEYTKNAENYIQPTDCDGREYPCVEWFHYIKD